MINELKFDFLSTGLTAVQRARLRPVSFAYTHGNVSPDDTPDRGEAWCSQTSVLLGPSRVQIQIRTQPLEAEWKPVLRSNHLMGLTGGLHPA